MSDSVQQESSEKERELLARPARPPEMAEGVAGVVSVQDQESSF